MNVLDLFSGACGGWSLGLHRAGFTTVAACEIDEWRRRQFARNFPNAKLYDDIRLLTAERLRDGGIGPIDLVCGSPPCQDASTANTKGKGIDGERTGLYLEAIRLVLEIRPRWAAFENVPGIRNRGIDRVLGALEAAGYAAWPLVVGALDLGAPHIRKRSWVICADAEAVHRLAQPRDQPDGNSECVIADAAQSRCETRGSYGLGTKPRSVERFVTCSVGAGTVADTSEPRRADSDIRWRVTQSEGRARNRIVTNTEESPKRTGPDITQPESEARPSDTIGAGLEIERGEPRDDGAERSPLERAIAERLGPIAQNWNGGIAGRLRMDDGLPRGMARPLLAAYGDAILPQISEIIGRAIMRMARAANDSDGKPD